MTVYLGDKAVGVNTIVEKEVPKVKFGASVDTFIGDVDDNGVLQEPSFSTELNFVGVKEIAVKGLRAKFQLNKVVQSVEFPDLVAVTEADAMYLAFAACPNLTTAKFPKLKRITKGFSGACGSSENLSVVDLTSLEEVYGEGATMSAFASTGIVELDLGALKTIGSTTVTSNSCCSRMFEGCSSLISVNLGNLITIGAGISSYAAQYMFNKCTNLKSVNLSKLENISSYGAAGYMFSECSSLESIDLSGLKILTKDGGVSYMFNKCTNLKSVNLSNLETIDGIRAASAMFVDCSALTTITFNSLTKIAGENAVIGMFIGCSGLLRVDFPSLTTVDANSFYTNTFQNCTALTEIHFRSDVQAAIEATTGYSSKWGATNATIYFDL